MLGALAGSAHVNLSAGVGGFRRDLHSAEREFSRFTRDLDRSTRRSGVQFARGLGAAVLGSIGPLFLLGKAVHSSWEELEAMRREAAQTSAVLASTGGVANVTAQDVDRLAQAGLRLSGVDDQLVQRGANVLLTFTKIRNEVGAGNDIFDQAVEAVLDMSLALETEMQPTAIQVGKALQDPILGITALRRVGVNFTRDQQKLIERLVETGHVLEAQKFILAELSTEFGGSAAAAGGEFPAALSRAEEAAASLGAAYLETLIPAIQEGAEWLEAQLVAFQDNEEAQEEFRAAVVGTAEVLVDLAAGANDVAQALGGWENVIKIIIAYKVANLLTLWALRIAMLRGEVMKTTLAFGAMGVASRAAALSGAAGVGAVGVGGKGKFLGLGRLGTAGLIAAGVLTADQLTGGHGQAAVKDAIGDIRGDGQSAGTMTKLRAAAKAGQLKLWNLENIRPFLSDDQYDELRKLITSRGQVNKGGLGDERNRGRPGINPPKLPSPKTEISIGTQQLLAEADRTESDVDDMKALLAAERELERMLEQEELTKKERLQITQDLARIEGSIRSIEDARESERESAAADRKSAAEDRKREAEERKREAEEARREAHDLRVFELERAVSRAEETAGVQDDLRKLIALRNYYRNWRDQQKRGSEDWREAQADLDSVNERIAGVRRTENARKDQIKRWRLDRRVRLAEETEGVQDDIKAYRALRAHLLAQRREHKRYSEEWMATQDEIDDVNAAIRGAKKTKTASKDGQFANFIADELANVLAEYAPNFFPDEGATPGTHPAAATARGRGRGGVTIVQEFPSAPTDYHREARYAVAAVGASFDG